MGNEKLDKKSDWFDLKLNKGVESEPVSNGRIALRVDLVPEDEAENDEVGKGRQEPNKDPYLPQPVGRLSFKFDLAELCREICPIWLRYLICMLICCVICLGIFMLIGTQLSGFVAIIELMQGTV